MILEQTFYAVQCDNCKIVLRYDDYEYWAGVDHVELVATDSMWVISVSGSGDKKHYCDDCITLDDDDQMEINEQRFKS